MNKTALIFRHEFIKTIKRTGFIILTLSLPVLALLGIGVFRVASGVTKPPAEVNKVGYVDELGGFDRFTTQGNITLVPFGDTQAATEALVKKDISQYFVIPADYISSGAITRYTTAQELSPPAAVISAVSNFITSNLLAGKVPADTVTRVESSFSINSITLTPSGTVAPHQAGYANFIVPAIFSLFLMFSLIFSSTYVLQSLAEEKENRIMEILLSSVSPQQLLIGKVLGLGAAGFLQVVVWVISSPFLLRLASSSIGGLIATLHVPAYFWFLGIIYFVLGYAIYAVLSASVAAVTSTVQEAQGLSGLYTLFNAVPLWFISLLLISPNSPLWVVFSLFPLTAPMEVMLRLGLLGVPIWQLVVSISLLLVCVAGGLWLAARLLRAYMLTYGKRPGLGGIIRSLRGAG